MRPRRLLAWWLFAVALPAVPALGHEVDAPTAEASPLHLLYDDDELFISATETAHTLGQAPAIASVITAQQIRVMGAHTLQEALQALPGLGVMYADTWGHYDGFEVRAVRTEESEKVLLLLDGHRLNWTANGSAVRTLSEFPLDGVARIEVIRGPGSALYGTGAFLAVINIIMDTTGPDAETAATLGAGNHAAARENLRLRHRQADAQLFGTFTHYESNGDPQLITEDAAGQSGPTHDWRNENTGYVHGAWDRLSLTGFVATRRRGAPNTVTGLVDTRSDRIAGQAFLRATYTTRADSAETSLDLSVDRIWFDGRHQLDAPGFAADANPRLKSQTVSAKARRSFRAGRHRLTLSADLDHVRMFDVRHILDGVDVSATFNHVPPATRRVAALYVQDEWEAGDRAVLTAGFRWDHYSDFGASLNPRLAYVRSPTSAVDLKLLYGRAFRAPSFFELYEQNNPVVLGNPDLKAETMDTAEAGLDWRFNHWGTLSAAAFANRFRNRIVRTLPLTVNSGGADIHGIELELKADWRELRHGYANWTWNHAQDQQTGANLADVPRQRAKAGINWGLLGDRVSGNLGVNWAGRQSRPAGDTHPSIKAYTVFNMALTSVPRGGHVDWAFTVRNLLDRRVLDPVSVVPGDVPRPGRTWLLEVGYRY